MAKSKKKHSKFNYKKRSRESVEKRAKQTGGKYDSIFKDEYKVFKISDGKNLIRILPPTWDDADHYGYEIHVNYGIGADKQSYLSLRKMLNEKDPIEEARAEAEKENDEKFAKALEAKKRVVMWVIDRNAEEEGPQLFSAPWTVDRDIANLCIDEDTGEVIMVDDPDEGCDFRFYRQGTGLKTEYNASKMKLLKPSPIHDDEDLMNEWLEFIEKNPVPDCLNFFDYDHISGVFEGTAKPDDDEDEDEDEPKKKSKKKVTKKRKVDEDEDEPKKKKRRKVVVEDDEDEDEDEDESDEDESDEDESDEDESDEDEDEDEDESDEGEDEDDEPEPVKKSSKKSGVRGRLKNMNRSKKK